MDGIYLVTIANGTKLEVFDDTLRSRQDYAMLTMKNSTTTWRGKQYFLPLPVLANKDDKRKLSTSMLKVTNPTDVYWSDTIDYEQIRQAAKVQAEKVGCVCTVVFA